MPMIAAEVVPFGMLYCCVLEIYSGCHWQQHREPQVPPADGGGTGARGNPLAAISAGVMGTVWMLRYLAIGARRIRTPSGPPSRRGYTPQDDAVERNTRAPEALQAGFLA
jgi:hypothetical protein